MRISEKLDTKNFTGCVVTGAHYYAYFNKQTSKVIKNTYSDPGNKYLLLHESHRSLMLTFNSLKKFIRWDIDAAKTGQTLPNRSLDRYILTIDLYMKGNVQTTIDILIYDAYEVSDDGDIDVSVLAGFMASIVYLLTNLAEQKNVRVEYIWTLENVEPRIYSSSCVQFYSDFMYDDGYSGAIGLSFDMPPDLREDCNDPNERIFLYADIYLDSSKKYLSVSDFMVSGHIWPREECSLINVFKVSDDGTLLVYEFDGEVEFDFNKPKELFAVSLDDVLSGKVNIRRMAGAYENG